MPLTIKIMGMPASERHNVFAVLSHPSAIKRHGMRPLVGTSPSPWLPLTRLWPSVPHDSSDQSLTVERPTHRERGRAEEQPWEKGQRMYLQHLATH